MDAGHWGHQRNAGGEQLLRDIGDKPMRMFEKRITDVIFFAEWASNTFMLNHTHMQYQYTNDEASVTNDDEYDRPHQRNEIDYAQEDGTCGARFTTHARLMTHNRTQHGQIVFV